MGSTVRRLILLTALLGLYPLAMVLFHFAGDSGAAREQPSAISLAVAWTEHGLPGPALQVSVDLRNDSLAQLSASELLLNVLRDGKAETALILSGGALGAAGPVPPGGQQRLGPYLLPLTRAPGRAEMLLQASLTVVESEQERRFEVRDELLLPPAGGEAAKQSEPDATE